ncbi:MAG TPA: amino acid ABC transporter substrate-binding protein, partial [Pyrodictium sp.]|nr:amino acid ABC transporter substrate-binding protein [Pyrodictium sp.]
MASPRTNIAIAVIAVLVIAGIALYLGDRGKAPEATPTPTTAGTPAASPAATPAQQPQTQTVQAEATTAAGGLSGEVQIGALLPLTGDLASYGENSKVALELAERDINAFLEKAGAPFRIKIVVEDTETKPEVALQKIQALAAKGIKFYIGPQTSAEVRQIKNFADQNKLLVISQSSTLPALAIPNDYIFRFCPTDNIQGPVIAKMAKHFGA